MHIYLIRHGQKQLHAGDPGLTETGVEQAKQTGKFLSKHPISKIIASPFKRTVQTAEHIANELGLEFELNKSLVERMNWNDDNVTRDEFLREWIKATHDRHYVPKFGDSSHTTGKRIEQLIDRHSSPEEHIVLVTHGGAILDYIRTAFGDHAIKHLKTKYKEGYDYQMMNCSINKIVIEDSPRIELLNHTKHLEEKSE